MNHKHFEGKSTLDHLIAARKRGANVQEASHGTETPGFLGASFDALRETCIYLLALWMLFESWHTFFLFALLLGLWKAGRAARLGWARLERLHRMIEQERWEITHHRAQEKEELKEMYAAKGMTGALLDECVEVLMADDNRLLQVMLEEEMGLTLESFEHPLKQGAGALVGVILGTLGASFGIYLWGLYGGLIAGGILFILTALLSSKFEGNDRVTSIVWQLSLGIATLGVIYFVHL